MNSNFSWQTEEEGWVAASSPPPPPRARRTPVRLAVVLAVLLLLGGFAFWQVNAHLDRVTQRIEGEVLASYGLLETAAQAQDPEVLGSFLSRRDREWAATQMLLAERGMLLTARFFGLQPADSAQAPDVQLAPDLSQAEVVVIRSYTTTGEDGSIQTMRMQERFFFRRDADRWLWTAPGGAFWGESVYAVYEHLSLTYPKRDAETARRLGADLNRLAGRLCGELAQVTCPAGYRISVRLDPDAATLLQLSDWQGHLGQGNTITLPAPSLIGTPLDDGAYQALWHGYARYFVAPAIAELTGYKCCDRALSFQRTLEAQLGQLGVGWWAPTPSALPGDTLQLYCVARTAARQALFTYEPWSDAWQVTAWLPEELVAVQQVPLAGGAWLVRDGSRRVFLFDGERQILVAESPPGGGVVYALAERDPTRTKVTVQAIDRAAKATSYSLFDLERCGSTCSLQPLSGRPVWSADGGLTINYRDEPASAGRRETYIFLGDADGDALTAVPAVSQPGESFSFPVWLDDDTYGFIRHRGSGAARRPALVIARATRGERSNPLTLDDLPAPLPRD
jgi:hypothetical protein